MSDKIHFGVVVGRFQVPQLTSGHRWFLEHVAGHCEKILVVLGSTGRPPDRHDPLSFGQREHLIYDYLSYLCPNRVHTVELLDVPGRNDLWSQNLDALIRKHAPPTIDITLFGSRDSFLKCYEGNFRTCLLETRLSTSGTEARDTVGKTGRYDSTLDFRRGVIWATQQQFPRVFPTVDIALLSNSDIYLGRKPDQELWRFPGGFVDPLKDRTLEEAAARELKEETGVDLYPSDFRYVASFRVDDPRYRKEDRIMTTLFKATVDEYTPKAGDDLAEIRSFPLHMSTLEHVEPGHKELFAFLLGTLR